MMIKHHNILPIVNYKQKNAIVSAMRRKGNGSVTIGCAP